MTLAFLFPGQGSQAVGMGQALAEHHAIVRETLDEAERISGVPLRRLCFEGPAEELQQTQNAQLALLTVSTAIARLLHAHGVRPQFAAGHSLGEYSALVEGDAIAFERAVMLVKRRGELMADAGKRVPGTMAAVLGFDAAKLERLCAEAKATVVIANYNSPDQWVLSGTPEGVAEASERARAEGAKRVIPLNVSGAFHSPLMHEPAREFAPTLDAETYVSPAIKVLANLDAGLYGTADEIPRKLAAQLDHPVRWQQCAQQLLDLGVDTCVEVGPGRVLSGLMKKLSPQVQTLNVEDPASLSKTLAALGVAV
ncbi:MAG TPA: ACP S-malonyltransferase [Oscillatoriaceae cyanobacterium]